MPTRKDEEDARARLIAVLEDLAQLRAQDLARPELGRDLNFEEGRQDFERILKLFDEVRSAALENASHSAISQILGTADSLLQRFHEVQNFSANQANPVNARNALLNTLRDEYETVYGNLTPILAYAGRKGTELDAVTRDARKTLDEIRTSLDEIRASREEQRQAQEAVSEETTQLVDSMRRAAADVGIERHSIHFTTEAADHAKSARRWLIATATLGAFTLIVVTAQLWVYLGNPVSLPGLPPSQSIQLGISKVALLSVLYFAMMFCGRIYRAHQHNITVNKHRQNALSTFEAFVKASSEKQTKDAVLLYAAQSIFAAQTTGFSAKESEQSGSPQILEVFRTVGKEGP